MAASPIFILILIVSIAGIQSNDSIDKTCKTTKYYDLCFPSLKSDPTSKNTDFKGLATIMIGIGMANSTATSSYLLSQLLSAFGNDVAMKKVLKECVDKYGFAAEAL
ncbi:hypothetical protein F8388_021134 [Cannabis sativa]|uniref:Pectinesterase inhibitor domain-containing protein n=1 Tax=Cannabis sativa TaxID=3483 RepID=A0A7J6DVX5_CANSA|nr:hypothetical protein G4B88_000137 [Cannabis sativa]KAF4388304.1 hypothetical protein F8388_021134 [Cannabis sativa]